ncbi:MAG: VOC family protein [Alicyclobacillus mali]|nr:VOC family protein [Alicyclobacillus mali (ex Roth et al. 2021)]
MRTVAVDHIVNVDEILHFVPDVQEAKTWYQALLGTGPVFDHEAYCAFRVGDTLIGLHPTDDKTGCGVAGQVAYWRVQDLQRALDHFLAHGCHVFRGPSLGVDGVWVCQVLDPYGHAWGLVQRS